MESNNQFSQELPSESSKLTASALENSTDRELNDLELDALAGGRSDMADRARAAGMRVVTTNAKYPDMGLISLHLIEAASRAVGNRK
ncbi:hypothetical protein [Microcoleus sp. B9-D4]|uniref:hypothetical protein n=1 Tax=Microcoleus sp. B9-D4 TaxID=2818711 RepID=UPI002FD133E6